MRLLIVSNRLPITVEKQDGKLELKQSVGGLVSGINDYLNMIKSSDFLKPEYLWIGSPGMDVERKNKEELTKKFLDEYRCQPVFLSEKVMEKFYQGFCNKTLWPLFHSFPSYVEYDDEYWQIYKEVNFTFAQQVLKVMEPEDIIWIHDYHLMLLPQMLRNKIPEAKIIFFLHIPFPHFELFNLLPKKWRSEILKGILGAEVVGFHTYEYLQNFLQCILRFLGYEHEMGKILTDDRLIKAGAFPIGINFQKFYEALNNPKILGKVKELKQKLDGYKVLLSIDRLDYTKGVINRLKGYDLFLKENPQYLEKVVLIMVIVPSRVGIEQYQRTKRQIDELVGRINGRFGNVNWTPILYQTTFLPFDNLVTFYNIADVALIIPLRDGMNLIAKEYIASRTDGTGVLILSEMAGVSKELTEAILINPYDISAIASSIKDALEMPVEEQIRCNKKMQERLKRYHVGKWGDDLIKELLSVKEEQKKFSVKLLTSSARERLLSEYQKAKQRLIFLDYDGTLIPFAYDPKIPKPDVELLNLLKELADDGKNEVVILSGRDKDTLQQWFSSINISMAAEHGILVKEKGKVDWEMLRPLKNDWKTQILSTFQTYSDRLPGSFIEEKDYSLALHYRQSDPEQSSIIVKDAVEYLISFTANLDIQVLQADKVIEIRCAGINKGTAALWWQSRFNYDFILAIGDDLTDEDLFKVLPQESFAIKVGITQSNAKFNVRNYIEVRELLKQLIKNEIS